MAACGPPKLEKQPSKDFALKSEDDSTIISKDQTVVSCLCEKVKIEICQPEPLGASISVKTEDHDARKYCAGQDGYGGREEMKNEELDEQYFVYFANELKILKGDDYVRFSMMAKYKATNDYIRMYTSCCHTILFGYSKKFLGWEKRRVAYSYSYKKRKYQGKEVPKPACITWKSQTGKTKKDLSNLQKKWGLKDQQKQVLKVGQIKQSGKDFTTTAMSDWGRYRVKIGVVDANGKLLDPVCKETGKKGHSFEKLMAVQLETMGEDEPDQWGDPPSSPRKSPRKR